MKLTPCAERVVELRVRFGFAVLLAPRHRAEADLGDVEVGAGQRSSFHRIPMAGRHAPHNSGATLHWRRVEPHRFAGLADPSFVPAPPRLLPAVLHRVRRRGARLHDTDDDRRLADGNADAVGADGGAGADGEHGAFAAAGTLRRRARGPGRPPAGDPDHADRRCSRPPPRSAPSRCSAPSRRSRSSPSRS